MKRVDRRMVSRVAFLAVVLATLTPAFGQAATRGYTPSEGDFELPLQDLDSRKGEIIWLQGGLKRGDTAPYRNPLVPLASYEHGLLDAQGNLWTFLDNPKGRELRYNKLLRGKNVEVKGWFYDRTQIIEVYSWTDAQSHPVRSDTGYPEPIKIPFNPIGAETIEPIPPVTPAFPGDDLLGEDMWRIREGLDLFEDSGGAPIFPPPDALQEGDRLRRFIEESHGREGESPPIAPPAYGATLAEPAGAPDRIDLRTPDSPRSPAPPPLPRTSPPIGGDAVDPVGIERGLTDTDEMFDASRRALLE